MTLVGLLDCKGDVEDAVLAWLDRDDLNNAEGSLFECVVAAMGLERVGSMTRTLHPFHPVGCRCSHDHTEAIALYRLTYSAGNKEHNNE